MRMVLRLLPEVTAGIAEKTGGRQPARDLQVICDWAFTHLFNAAQHFNSETSFSVHLNKLKLVLKYVPPLWLH